jgi:hypothetical protein
VCSNDSTVKLYCEELTIMGSHTHAIEYVSVPYVISRKRADKIDGHSSKIWYNVIGEGIATISLPPRRYF